MAELAEAIIILSDDESDAGDSDSNQSNSTLTNKALPWPESETGHLAGMGLCLRLLCGGDVRLTCLRR